MTSFSQGGKLNQPMKQTFGGSELNQEKVERSIKKWWVSYHDNPANPLDSLQLAIFINLTYSVSSIKESSAVSILILMIESEWLGDVMSASSGSPVLVQSSNCL